MAKKHPPENNRAVRVVSRDKYERIEAVAIGKSHQKFGDIYAILLDMPWRILFSIIALTYIVINIFFALLYLAIGNGIENVMHGSFLDAFFFSVQTMATIGYGKMSPVGIAANTLVTVEALAGFCFIAVMTGIIFTKFSRPTARLLFSNVAVVCPYNGVPHLMLRLANERGNRIVDANVHLTLLRLETSHEGHKMRRFHDMHLVRSHVPILQLTWTVMHPLDEKSPLYDMKPEMLKESDAEIIISLTGLDETLSQTIHARYSYLAEEILYGHTFEDIMRRLDDRRMEINYSRFHSTKKIS